MDIPSYDWERGNGGGEIDFGTLFSRDRPSNTNDRLIIRSCTRRLIKCILLLLLLSLLLSYEILYYG